MVAINDAACASAHYLHNRMQDDVQAAMLVLISYICKATAFTIIQSSMHDRLCPTCQIDRNMLQARRNQSTTTNQTRKSRKLSSSQTQVTPTGARRSSPGEFVTSAAQYLQLSTIGGAGSHTRTPVDIERAATHSEMLCQLLLEAVAVSLAGPGQRQRNTMTAVAACSARSTQQRQPKC